MRRKNKSFNVNTKTKFIKYVCIGAATGLFLSLFVLSAFWNQILFFVSEVLETVRFFTTYASFDVPYLGIAAPTQIAEYPHVALPVIWQSQYCQAFDTCCILLTLSCALLGAHNFFIWKKNLYDGTWIGSKRANSEIHGSAELISKPSDLKQLSHSWSKAKKPQGTIVVGELGDNIQLIDSIHACVLADSGDGKSRRIAALSILANVLQGRSVIVNDIKGELRAWLTPYIKELGTHKLINIQFDNPGCSMRYDPLYKAKVAYEEYGVGVCKNELTDLANAIIPEVATTDNIFVDGARDTFIGIALGIISSQSIPEEQKTLASVSACISATAAEDTLERIHAFREWLPANSPALSLLSGIDNERSGGPSMAKTMTTYLNKVVDSFVAPMLHDNEIDLAKIGTEPTVVFLSSASDTKGYEALTRVFVAQALASLRRCAKRAGYGHLPVETILVLDEAASLGRTERLIEDLGEIRSEGICVQWYCQSLNQLQSVSKYTRVEAESILDLLKDKVILSCSNVETAERISKTMGTYTAFSESTSKTRTAHSGSTGSSEGLVERRLIAPGELTSWKAKKNGVLVMHDGETMAFPSKDISETFVAKLLGLTSKEAEAELMRAALSNQEERNPSAPPVWRGPNAREETSSSTTSSANTSYTPEGF